MVPSCMLGAGIWGTYESNLRNLISPLGPKSDQHQLSPNSINRSVRVKVMRIVKLITEERTL